MSPANLLQAKWEDEHCPIADGVFYVDGHAFLFEYDGDASTQYTISDRIPTTLDAVLAEDPEAWTYVTPHTAVSSTTSTVKAIGGGAGFGADGFVAVVSTDTGRLRWIAFSQQSNPFHEVSVANDFVIARSTSGSTWSFPIDRPEQVEIEWSL